MKYVFFIISLMMNCSLWASSNNGTSGVGNGGDPIRDSFFMIGKNIIETYSEGLMSISDELRKNGVSRYSQLENFLSINTVHTSLKPLYDNQGSVVSALGSPGSITLYVGNEVPSVSWNTLLLDTSKSERIILHEMLRAAGVNDDNYIFTNKVLKNQGQIFNENFHFTWSKANDSIITLTLSNSFNARDSLSELNFFRESANDLIHKNQLHHSELMKFYVQFIVDLDARKENSAEDVRKMLSSYRETFRNLKEINSTIDLLAIHQLNGDPKANLFLIKYFILSLKQIPNAFFIFADVDWKSLVAYVQSLNDFASSDYFSESLLMLQPILHEFELMIQNHADRESIVKKNRQIIASLQNIQEE